MVTDKLLYYANCRGISKQPVMVRKYAELGIHTASTSSKVIGTGEVGEDSERHAGL